MSPTAPHTTKQHFGPMLALYLCGLLIGGLYVGMVAPVRTVVQAGFCIDDAAGIWMINIYTLFYAAFIPIIGKIADSYGRKRIFSLCLGLFALGLLACGFSQVVANYPLLLAGRVVQAIGACGMIPVANAEIGTSFPAEKRGMALGIAAATTGLANVMGAGVGSLVIGLVGIENWAWLFWGCVPVCVVLAVGAAAFLPNHTRTNTHRLDLAGSALFVAFVLLLLLSLRNIDFLDLNTFTDARFWTLGILALVALFAFRAVEHRAADPVFHLEYLHNPAIVVTLVTSFFIGCTVVSMQLVPEFAEFVMDDPLGSGGYYVIALGVFSLAGPMISGRLIDRHGPKPILMTGLVIEAAGFLSLATIATWWPNALLMIACLSVIGLGMGFAMGAPTNYMVLEQTCVEESAAAISTITLVRQIGTTLAPAVLVSFVTNNPGIAGYQNMMACVVVFCLASLVVTAFYRSPRN